MTTLRSLAAALAVATLAVPLPAGADEPLDPVRVLMEMATHNSGDPADGTRHVHEDYFSANMLLRFFSADFNRAFGEAFLRTNALRQELMIDWDPVIGGQDSCPLKDIRYGAPETRGGRLTIDVAYNATHCFGGDTPARQMSTVTFTLVKEELVPGSPLYLIDDIAHGSDTSLRNTLGEIGRQ